MKVFGMIASAAILSLTTAVNLELQWSEDDAEVWNPMGPTGFLEGPSPVSISAALSGYVPSCENGECY